MPKAEEWLRPKPPKSKPVHNFKGIADNINLINFEHEG